MKKYIIAAFTAVFFMACNNTSENKIFDDTDKDKQKISVQDKYPQEKEGELGYTEDSDYYAAVVIYRVNSGGTITEYEETVGPLINIEVCEEALNSKLRNLGNLEIKYYKCVPSDINGMPK